MRRDRGSQSVTCRFSFKQERFQIGCLGEEDSSKTNLPPLPVPDESSVHYASRLCCFLWSSLGVARCQHVRMIVRVRSTRNRFCTKLRIRRSRTQTVRRDICAPLKRRNGWYTDSAKRYLSSTEEKKRLILFQPVNFRYSIALQDNCDQSCKDVVTFLI